jgi:hypothetical protein
MTIDINFHQHRHDAEAQHKLEQLTRRVESLEHSEYKLRDKLKEVEKLMVSQTDLDGLIAGLPAAITGAMQPVLAPIITKINNIPNADFTAEAASLTALPQTIADAVTAAFAASPVTPTTPITPPVVPPVDTTTPTPVDTTSTPPAGA